jgi:flagellar hook-associated protein 2
MLQSQMTKVEQQKSAFGTINTSLLALKTVAEELAKAATWSAKAASVSDPSVVSARVSSETQAGTYTFSVAQLAAASQLAGNGYADQDTAPVGEGSFDLTVGGTTVTVNVGATDTLQGVALAINALDLGVTATVVNTGSGATPYKMILASNETGVDNATSVANNTSGMTFAEITQAKNAVIQFGEDSPITVESATNTVTGLAPGLTLDLLKVSAAPVTVKVSSDVSGIVGKAQDFIAKYNAVQSGIKKYTDYDAVTEQAALLFGNSTLRFISSDLGQAVGNQVADVDPQFNSLMMVGFTLKGDGTLELDESAFRQALADNSEAVKQLFSGADGIGKRLADQLSFITSNIDGAIAGEQSSLDTRIRDMEAHIADLETRMEAKEARLRAQFTAMEVALSQMQAQSTQFLSQLASISSSSKK